MDEKSVQVVAKALEERRKFLVLAGKREVRFWRFMLGPLNEKGKRIRELSELRAYPWLNSILIHHRVESFVVGLHPRGYFFGVGIVEGKWYPGPHLNSREGMAYLRFEEEDDIFSIVRTIARVDALAELHIAREESSWPFSNCPVCGKVSWWLYHRVLEHCDGKFVFEREWKKVGERTDTK